jgi:hypothetical protein
MIIQHRAWAKRVRLLNAVRDSLRTAEPRLPYYPGAFERWEQFVDAYRSAERFGPAGEDRLPFTLIPELDPDQDDELAFSTEPFCAVLSEVGLDALSSVRIAVRNANVRLRFTLTTAPFTGWHRLRLHTHDYAQSATEWYM